MRGVEVRGTAAGMHHESWRHSISPYFCGVASVSTNNSVDTKSHRAVKDTHIHTRHQNVPLKQK